MKSKQGKISLFSIVFGLVIIISIILYSNYSKTEANNSFGEITIGSNFYKNEFSKEYDVFNNKKVMDNYEFPDHTKVYIDRLAQLMPRKNNISGDENNYLKFMSNEVIVGINKDKKIGLISFEITNDNNNFGKIIKSINEKGMKVVSQSISKDEDKEGFYYTIQYSNNNNNIRTVLLLHSKVYYDVINNKEMKFDIKDIDALSISFYDIDLLENEGDNINLFWGFYYVWRNSRYTFFKSIWK